jgi:hypothetical protein
LLESPFTTLDSSRLRDGAKPIWKIWSGQFRSLLESRCAGRRVPDVTVTYFFPSGGLATI